MIKDLFRRARKEPNLYFVTPYHKGDLGFGYNDILKKFKHDDWVCVMDGDVMFLNNDFGEQILNVIKKNPEAGIITCLTNRIGSQSQLYNEIMSEEGDIRKHKIIANDLHEKNYEKVTKIDEPISGFLLCFQISTFKKAGMFDSGILHIDRHFANRVRELGKPILRMDGLYVLHYYRLNEGHRYTSHLV